MQNWKLPQKNHYKKIAYVNARLFDPYSGLDETGGILVENGKVIDFGSYVKNDNLSEDINVVNCYGNLLAPGLVDIQVHFREPGLEYKETIQTGSKSAAAGGVTSVVCMPNTKPVLDSTEHLKDVIKKAEESAYIDINFYPAVTKNMAGEEMNDLKALKELGACGFTDDGLPVMASLIMRKALEKSKELNVVIAQHAEDINLSNGGAINEGEISKKLGVRGISNATEAIIVDRDIRLTELTGGYYHLLHVSTKEALESIRKAKEKGLNVTCEITPHHFQITHDAVLEHGANAKMNPPLRSQEDLEAMLEGLKDGTIDAIATDHAPHELEAKSVSLEKAAFGIVGLETMLPLSLDLYHRGILSLPDVMAKLTYKPAEIIRKEKGKIKKGADADFVLIDLDKEWVIEPENFAGKSRNSPFKNRKVKGRAVKTIYRGQVIYDLNS